MKRILIADDEQPILTGLKLLLKKYHAQDYTVIGEAHNGREAVELAEETTPDIILIDVQMPGLNGLEAIETISRRGIKAAFILITAFERFEIAREALKLGVCDYILKPVSRERLELALNTAVLHLGKLEYFRKKEIEFAEKEKQLSGILKDNFFYSVRNNTITKEQVYAFKTAAGLSKHYAFVLLSSFPGGSIDTASALMRHMQYKTDAVPLSLAYEGAQVYLIPQRDKVEDAAGAFVDTVAGEFSAQLTAGELLLCHGPVEALEDLSNSWNKALQRLYSSFEAQGKSGWNRAIDRSFYEAVAAGQYRKASGIIWDTAVYAKENAINDHASFLRIAGMLLCLASRESIPEPVFERTLSLRQLEALWTSGNHEAFNNRLRLMLEDLGGETRSVHSPLVAKAFAYIQNNFAQQISLESAASAFSISSVHLSRTLKEETGKGFARTLAETRLEHAKKMLYDSSLSIKEISVACGYQDPNYFSRAFKSYTGLTPAEFRQKEQSNEQ